MQVLAGHPQYVYYTAIVLTLYAALLTWRAPRRWSFLIGFVAMYLGGAMLSAVQLLAGMHAAGESLRGGGRRMHWRGSSSSPSNTCSRSSPRASSATR